MSKLSTEDIKLLVESKQFELIDASNYKNLNSFIRIKCKKEHLIDTTVATIRKHGFRCPSCEGETVSNFSDSMMPPHKDGYRIIALDQASKKIGVSVYDDGKLVYFNLIEITGSFEERLVKIYNFLITNVIQNWKPDYLVFEDIQLQDNVLTFKTLAIVLGICILAAEQHHIEHTEILNSKWQTEFYIKGGNRAAQKNEVMRRVKEYYKIDVNDDIADAILLGRYAASKLSSKWFKSDF